jgi:hypothetical protein
MARDSDELIRKFRELIWRPRWPIGVVVTPQMHEVFDWLIQHRDARGTNEYAVMHDWLAEQMGLSSDTLAASGAPSRASQINDNPPPSSVPAASPPATETPAEAAPQSDPSHVRKQKWLDKAWDRFPQKRGEKRDDWFKRLSSEMGKELGETLAYPASTIRRYHYARKRDEKVQKVQKVQKP